MSRKLGAIQLHQELEGASRLLFITFGWTAASIGLLLLHAILPNMDAEWKIGEFSLGVGDLPRRAVQALVAVCASEAILRATAIPSILRAVLRTKRDIAVFEARKSLKLNAPTDGDIKKMFPKKEGFGSKVIVERTGQ